MKLDFASVPVIDNHCHPLSADKAILEPEQLAREFFHGMGDIPKPGVKKPRHWGATEGLQYHIAHMGAVQTLICQLARVLDCPPELEAVAAARNRCTADDFGGYARLLYADAGIVGTVVDSDLPPGAPGLKLIPGTVLRLFQMGPAIKSLLPAAGSFAELRSAYGEALERAVRQDGFAGVKSHLAEEAGFGAPFCSDSEAEAVLASAQAGDGEAYKRLYVALFQATLLQAQELDVPVHLHSGITGGFWNGPIANADPFLLMPLLRRNEFLATRVVLLHGAYPWVEHAAMMAHSLPHLWVDVSWMTPWASLRIVECYRDLIGIAPLSKLMIGSGSHGTPEISWLAGITAKIALGKALGDAVELGLMTHGQAENAGRLILHDNAARLYGLDKSRS